MNTPQIYPDQQVQFSLEYTNSRSQPIPAATLIDVFPFNGDGRAMATDYTGTLEFDSVVGSKGGETFYFTSDDPTTIVTDANDPSNVLNTPGATAGTTIWCLPTDFGADSDCPTANSDVTGMYVTLGVIPNDGAGYNFTLTFNTAGNQKGDIYTNHFEVAPQGLLNTISNEVSSIVVGSELGDYVWEDENENGVQDEPASSGINGVLATLWDAGVDMLIGGGDDTQVTQDASGNPITPQTTANDDNGNPGFYLFRNLLPSWYYVVFDNLPMNFAVTDQADPSGNGAGDGSDDSDVNSDDSSSEYLHSNEVEIGANETVTSTDLGLFEQTIDLELTKEVDADGDGIYVGPLQAPENIPLPNINGRGDAAIDYRLTLNNTNGEVEATGVEVTDYVPEGVTITGATPSAGTITNTLPLVGPANLVWNVGSVATTGDTTLDLEAVLTSVPSSNTTIVNLTEVTASDQTDTDSSPDNIDDPFVISSKEDDEATVVFDVNSAVGDYVFEDTDGNGIQDSGETGIGGVTVNLYQVNKGNTLIDTTTTLADGSYIFDNLNTASNVNYAVEFVHSTAPTGYAPSPQTQTTDITVDSDGDITTGFSNPFSIPAAQYVTNLDQGYIPLLSIGDFVFEDTNGNGIQDNGETGIEGVTINLYDATDLTTPLTSATSLPDGSYVFNNLNPAIDYVVEFDHSTAPGYTPSLQSQGGDTTLDSDGDQTTGRTSVIDLSNGQNVDSIDQGYVPRASIGDLVFVDTNGNGIQDSGETGIEGVTINLYDPSDLTTPIDTTTSLPDGSYIFDNLDSQLSYVIEFDHSTAPTGYTPSPQGQGGDTTLDSDGDITTGQTTTISFVGSEPNLNLDQGFVPLLSLGDLIFEDSNNNGILDSSEVGLEGVTINLYQDTDNDGIFDGGTIDTLLPFGSGSTLPGTSVTDANGNYLFDNLEAGGYFALIPASQFNPGGPLAGFTPSSGQNGSISGNYETAPGADTDIDSDDNGTLNANGDYVSSLITLEYGNEPTNDGDTLSTTNTTIDFSLYQMSCLSSLVWEDLNGDGVYDTNEPFFSGVEVILYDKEGNQIATTTSDSNGEYQFCYLTEGDYYIEYGSLPFGYQLTDNSQDSQADPSTFRTPTFTIGYNEQNQTLIESGVVSTSTLESINLIRTGRVRLTGYKRYASVVPLLLVSGGFAALLLTYKRIKQNKSNI